MNKVKKKNPALNPTPSEEHTESNEFSYVENDSDGNLPLELQDFLDTNSQDQSYVCKVYQTGVGKNTTARMNMLIDEYEGRCPSIKEIGQENGSGRYEWVLYIRDSEGKMQMKTYRIFLAPRWDRVRDQYLMATGQLNTRMQPDSQVSQFGQLKELMAMVSAMIQPIMAAQAASNAGNNNPAALLNGMVEMQSKVLNQNLTNGLDMQKQMFSEIAETRRRYVDEFDSSEGGKDGAVITEVIGILKQFAPMLLNAPRATAETMATKAIDTQPKVRAIIESGARRAALIDRIQKEFDQKTGRKILDILESIGTNGKKRLPVSVKISNKK